VAFLYDEITNGSVLKGVQIVVSPSQVTKRAKVCVTNTESHDNLGSRKRSMIVAYKQGHHAMEEGGGRLRSR